MIESFIIALREGIEAALIVGIILGYLKKTGALSQAKPVYYGVGLGIAASIAVAALFVSLSVEFEGKPEQVFEGSTMFLAAAILTTMILWMHQNSKQYSDDLKRQVDSAMGRTKSYGLASLAFISIFREGIETVLFLGSASFTSTGVQILIGGALGLLLAVLIGFAIMRYSVRLNLKTFFDVTGVLLIFFAAGLIAHGIHEFEEAGVFNPLVEHVYDINWLVNGDSTAGQLLGTLFGYDPSPSMAQIIGYLGYWAIIAFWIYQDTTLHIISRAVAAIKPT